jgi:hypothetical protein
MLARIVNCGSGVNRDLMPSELAPDLWSDCQNARFRNGFAEKRRGIQAAFTTPTVVPYYIDTYNAGSSRFLVQAGLAKVFVDDGTTRTEITPVSPFTGAVDNRWTGGSLQGTLILNNGVDSPMYWNGDTATDLAALTGWTPGWKSDVIRPFKYYLVALGNTRGGAKQIHNVGWSNSAQPGAIPTTWTAATGNDAGAVDLAETTGVMVDCLPWGDVNIIYKQDARYAMQYIGGNDVFRFVRLPGSDGLLARGCVVNTPKGQVFMSSGDVRIHQGGDSVSIIEGSNRRWLFNNMDSTNAGRSFLAVNPQKNEVWVCFPSTGSSSCDRALVWNWQDNTWGDFTLPNVTYGTTGLVPTNLSSSVIDSVSLVIDTDTAVINANDYSQNENRLVLSTTDPKIGLAETGSTDFGTAVPFMLEKTGISFGDTDAVKVLNASRPQINAIPGTVVTVYHGSAMHPADAVVYSAGYTFTVGTSTRATSFARGGRYMAWKMTSSDYAPVVMKSNDIEYIKQGRF